jgi:hypothetical protein
MSRSRRTLIVALTALVVAAGLLRSDQSETLRPEPRLDLDSYMVIGDFAQWRSDDYPVRDIHTSGAASVLTHIDYSFGGIALGTIGAIFIYQVLRFFQPELPERGTVILAMDAIWMEENGLKNWADYFEPGPRPKAALISGSCSSASATRTLSRASRVVMPKRKASQRAGAAWRSRREPAPPWLASTPTYWRSRRPAARRRPARPSPRPSAR